MPAQLAYPGVYIEEIPSGVRTIVGVGTSITAFIGYTPKGPANKATKIFNFGEFERIFGEMEKENELGYAVGQFFSNGGSEAWVVRVALGAVKSSIILNNGNAANLLTVEAKTEGLWGNWIRLEVDYETVNPDSTFNLTVNEFKLQGTEVALNRKEVYSNLCMDRDSPKYAVDVVNASSQLIGFSRHPNLDDNVLMGLNQGWSQSGDLGGLKFPLIESNRIISIMVDGDGPHEVDIFNNGNSPTKLSELIDGIKNAVRAINPANEAFNKLRVEQVNALRIADNKGNYLLITSGTPATIEREHSSVHIFNASASNASKLLKLGLSNGGREKDASADIRPIQNGTTSGDLSDIDLTSLKAGDKIIMNLKDGGTDADNITIDPIVPGAKISTIQDLVDLLQSKVKDQESAHPRFKSLAIQLIGNRLRIISRLKGDNVLIELSDSLATALKLTAAKGAKANVQNYSLGIGDSYGGQSKGSAGNNGNLPGFKDIQGNLLKKTGIYALEDADIFNLLCIPFVSRLDENSALSIIGDAIEYCMKRRAFMILDPPCNVNTPAEIKNWMSKLPASSYAALYYPYVIMPDSQEENRLKPFPPSGTIAGLFARTDSTRGVWKAPAGIDATLSRVQSMNYNLTDMENGDLNKLGINCLRSLPGYGRVSWGARTLMGSDLRADEWKYIPIRRLALYIEESLFRSLKWVVFEPNDEPLWAQIRLNVGAFMHSLFRQGAFQGVTPKAAYFVKCDRETTIQDDINKGIVNIVVGFAPLKPAEFVVIRIQQMAGQVQM
jgi:phage tail sheath protein FI